MINKFITKLLRNKWLFVKTAVLMLVLCFVASLEYQTLVMMLLLFVWRKKISRWCVFSSKKWGRTVARHSWKLLMALLVVQFWIALPRYRMGSDDRLQLYYVSEQGERVSTPISHWLFNALVPEEEVMNLGVWGARYGGSLLEKFGIGGGMAEQFKNDDAQGKISNFYKPYRSLDLKGLSLVSGTTSQIFNDFGIRSRTKSVYVLRPTSYDAEKTYPVVFFCHGYLGNWKLYQGLFAGMDDCFVVSCGTEGLSGIFAYDDISGLLNQIIPMLEREGHKINHEALYLVGLSNGGTACEVAQSSFPNRFKSITYISTGIHHTSKTRSTINLIGGGKDPSSSTMYPAYRTLKKNGTKANILWYDDESHFVLINKVGDIMSFIMHDVGASRAEAQTSLLEGIQNALLLTSLCHLLPVFYPLIFFGLLLGLSLYILAFLLCVFVLYRVVLAILFALQKQMLKNAPTDGEKKWMQWTGNAQRHVSAFSFKKAFRWFFRVIKKSFLAWIWYMKRYWLPILFLWAVSIYAFNRFESIYYFGGDWDNFMFHDEKDIGKCLGINNFPMCHVIEKYYEEGGNLKETVTFDTDDYVHYIKKLSNKVDKDSLWEESCWNEGEFTYYPDSLHIPNGLNYLIITFMEGERTFTISYK